MNFGVQQLQETLEKEGYRVLLSGIEDTLTEADRIIFLNQACDSTLRKEGFLITTEGNRTMVRGNDGNGVIYACRELIDHINEKKNLDFLLSVKMRRRWYFGSLYRFTENYLFTRTWCI